MPHESIQTYSNLPGELTAFLTNLTQSVKDHPNLRFDLSNPVHTGFFRVVDVRHKNGSEIQPGEKIYNNGEMGPDGKPIPPDYYTASEIYAFAPGFSADPEGTEKGEQLPINVRPDGTVETRLTEDELNNLFSFAKKGLLCVTPLNVRLITADQNPAYVILADENGKVDLNLISKSFNEPAESRTDAQKLIVQGVDSLHNQNTERFLSLDDDKIALAENGFTSMYWSARYLDQPILSKEELENAHWGNAESEFEHIKVRFSPIEELGKIMFRDQSGIRPLFDVETLRSLRDTTDRMHLFVLSRIHDAVKSGNVFQPDANGNPQRIFIGKDDRTNRDRYFMESLDKYQKRRSTPLYMTIARLFKKDAFQKDIDEINLHNKIADSLSSIRESISGYDRKKAQESLASHGITNPEGDVVRSVLVPKIHNGETHIDFSNDPEALIEQEKKVLADQSQMRESIYKALEEKHRNEFGILSSEERKNLADNLEKLTYSYARNDVNMEAWLQNGVEHNGMRNQSEEIASQIAANYVLFNANNKDCDIVAALKTKGYAEKITKMVQCTDLYNDMMFDKENNKKDLSKDAVRALREKGGINRMMGELVLQLPKAGVIYEQLSEKYDGVIPRGAIHALLDEYNPERKRSGEVNANEVGNDVQANHPTDQKEEEIGFAHQI